MEREILRLGRYGQEGDSSGMGYSPCVCVGTLVSKGW